MSEEHVGAARNYREVAEAYLGGRDVEAAGIFQREPTSAHPVYAVLTRLFERLTRGGLLSGLPEKFLLAVAQNKVYAFRYSDWRAKPQIQSELAAFDRDDIQLRRTPGGGVIYLRANEKGRADEIPLDGTHIDHDPGAAEVVAALAE